MRTFIERDGHVRWSHIVHAGFVCSQCRLYLKDGNVYLLPGDRSVENHIDIYERFYETMGLADKLGQKIDYGNAVTLFGT